jgi:pantothenate kinase
MLALWASPQINFSKEKKEKKKAIVQVEGFRKTGFFKKNTTRYAIEAVSVKSKSNYVLELFGWRFF